MNEVLYPPLSPASSAEEAGVDGEDEDGVVLTPSGLIDATTDAPNAPPTDLTWSPGRRPPQVNAARAALDAVGADVPVVGSGLSAWKRYDPSEAAHENEPRLAVPSCHGRR